MAASIAVPVNLAVLLPALFNPFFPHGFNVRNVNTRIVLMLKGLSMGFPRRSVGGQVHVPNRLKNPSAYFMGQVEDVHQLQYQRAGSLTSAI
jgi:hypothetical protein